MAINACLPYKNIVNTNLSKIRDINLHASNKHIVKNFYDGDNYLLIIQSLDDGYPHSMTLVELMEDRCTLLKGQIDGYNSYSNKWNSKLRQQSTLSSYHTTKRAQFQIVNSAKQEGVLLQTRYDAIQQVIISFKKQLKIIYPRQRFRTDHRHHRSNEMKRLFVNAQVNVCQISRELARLREQEERAQITLENAKAHYQALKDDETTSENKLTRAKNSKREKHNELQAIRIEIARREQDHAKEQENYRHEATQIYQQCRILQEEQLNLFRQTLIDFVQAIHSNEYSIAENGIYHELLSKIVSQQSTSADLDFWARTYHVDIPNQPIPSIEEDDKDDDTQSMKSVPESTPSITESTEEDQSSADRATTTEPK